MMLPSLVRLRAAFALSSMAALAACAARTPGASEAGAAAVAGAASADPSDPNMARALRVLRTTPIVDGHNDLPWAIREHPTRPRDVEAYDIRGRVPAPGQTDLPRLRQGMVGGQFWSVYIPGDLADSGNARVQLEQIDIARRVIARYPDLEPALRADDLARSVARGRIASYIGMEGGHAIENSLGALRAYYDLGVRYMTLTHNATLAWADAAGGLPTHGGLTRFGEEVVREMNRLGMLVDLSHVSPGTMSDALRVSEAPIIFSHSSARAITDHPRNVPDSILAKLPANGGVVMVTFVGSFISRAAYTYDMTLRDTAAMFLRRANGDSNSARPAFDAWRQQHPRPRATVGDVADHIEHIRRVAGIDHVGIGGDYDGTTDLPVGMEDVSTYPVLIAELARRGWSDAELRKVAGENVMRAMRRAEEVAARLQRERPPSTKTLRELDGATP
jgi:membrane dipeptidase